MPVVDIFKLKNRVHKSFAFAAVLFGECYTEITNTRVGKVLATAWTSVSQMYRLGDAALLTNIANIPTCAVRIILLLA